MSRDRAEKIARAIADKSREEVALAGGGFEGMPAAVKVAMAHGATIRELTDAIELLLESANLVGTDHVCQRRCFDGSDCGACFSCSCGQLRQSIDAYLERHEDESDE